MRRARRAWKSCAAIGWSPARPGVYDIRAIHAIDYPAGARFVRVTGTDLEAVPRLKFDLARGVAQIIESVSTGPA